MALINADTGNFKAKLATLKAGDTLQLAAGNYGSLYIANTNYGSGITIKGGTFSSIGFSKVTGVTLDGTTVIMTPTLTSTSNDQAIRAWASNNITITNAKITGGLAVNGVAQSATTLDASGNVLGLPVGKGINFESSNNVAVTNSDISFFHKGITFGLGSNVTVSGNTIHDLRTTPISGSVVSGLTITGNRTW
ncbi:MAG: right-handed parallel beta-helix repeat-containing protein, partial [Polymorphobacter sp.]